MAEGARLESVYRGNSIEGSNPSLSAMYNKIKELYRNQASFQSIPLRGSPSRDLSAWLSAGRDATVNHVHFHGCDVSRPLGLHFHLTQPNLSW